MRGPYTKDIIVTKYSKIRFGLDKYIDPALIVVVSNMDPGFYTSLSVLAHDSKT